jgi:signal transduction histidine kinase
LGNAYKSKEDFNTAKLNYGKALKFYEKFNSNFGIALINFNYGLIQNRGKEFNKAIPFFKKAYKIQKENNYTKELVLTLSSLAEAYTELGDLNRSERYLKEGIILKSDSKESLQELNLELFKLYEKKRKYKEALDFHKEYVIYKDSVLNESNIKSINELDKKYQTEKKDKEIATQQLELKEQETEIQKKKTQNAYMLGGIIFLVVIAILLIFLFKQRQKRINQEIQTLKREFQIKTLESLIEGEEKERFRIAKELHDGVNGDLSAIKYKLSSLLEMNNKVIKEAITMIDDSCKQVRAISHNLVPPALDNFDLVEATSDYCRNLNDINLDISILFQHIGDSVKMSKKAEINVFRIIQELVTNSVKHASATLINVQISSRENITQITVEDDGVGFKKNEITSDGIGLNNVQSRIDYLNATLDFVSNNKGTSYTIDIDKNQLNDN